MTRRLDAAQRAAEFFDLAFVGQFLAFGEFHEFEDFVQLINRVLERFGDFGGVQDGLMDGRNIGGTEISGFDPGFGAGGFGAAVGTFLTVGSLGSLGSLLPLLPLGAIRTFLWAQGRGTVGAVGAFGTFRLNLRLGVAFGLVHGRFFGMGFAKTAGGVGFDFRGFRMMGGSF